MKKCLLLLLFPLHLCAQNMVPNWSFESSSECPDDFNQIEYATGWKMCSENNDGLHHTDYLHACGGNTGTAYFQVPSHVWGYQNAATGNGYVALSTTALNLYPNYRENIYCKLVQPLVPGSTYNVSMKVCKSEKTKKAANKIGFKFSMDTLFAIDNTSDVYTDNVVEDTATWTVVNGTFTADSAYQYMAVGNFFTDINTTLINVCSSCPQQPSLYLIDDVCVQKGMHSGCNFTVSVPEFAVSHLSLECFAAGNELNASFTTNANGIYRVQIWNVLGQRVYSDERFFAKGTTSFAIPVASVTNGVVVLQVNGTTGGMSKAVAINP